MAADAVVQHMHLHPGGCALQQDVVQAPAEAVIADDEELQQDHLLGAGQGFEEGGEGGLAIDQQLCAVTGQAGQMRQPGQGAQAILGR